MTYVGDNGEISAEFHDRDSIENLRFATSGTHARFVATGAATRGQFGLYEWNMTPNTGGADGHFHKTFSESFFITAGTVDLFNGEKWVAAQGGEFLYVPEGGVHGFRNTTDEPASMLILFAPGRPRENYFRELVENQASGRKLSPQEWVEFWARHDQYPAG